MRSGDAVRRRRGPLAAIVIVAIAGGAIGLSAVRPQAPPQPAPPSPAGSPGQAASRWTTKADMPTPRLGAVAVEQGGSIFVIGGIPRSGKDEGSIPDSRAVEQYDPSRDRWTQHARAPLDAKGAVSVGNRLLVIGKSDVYELDPATDAWRPRAPMPAERTGFAVAAVAGKIVVIGGMVPDATRPWGWSNTGTVDEFDPAKNAWRSRAAMMTPRHQMAVAVVGPRVHVFGGAATYFDDMDRDIDRLEVYDAAADRWLVGPRMPRPLAYFSAFEAAGRLLTFPGSGAQVGLQEYEHGTLRWRLVEDPPPTARWRYAAAMSGGRVYLFGGVPRGAGADALRTTEEYRLPANPPAPDDRR